MAKFFSILLSTLVLFQSFNLDLSDMAHVDELIEHAQFHSEKYGDNFIVFISKHYGEMEKEHKADHQEENEEHEKLPFTHHCCSHVFTVYVMNKMQLPELKTGPVADYTSNFYYLENYSFLGKPDIFQPPKTT